MGVYPLLRDETGWFVERRLRCHRTIGYVVNASAIGKATVRQELTIEYDQARP
jgi:hypothetical protein